MLKTEFELYEDQKVFVSDIRKKLYAEKRIIACAATGAGKSKVFCTIAVGALQKGKTVLIISESRRIFSQIQAEIECVEISAGYDGMYIEPNKVYLAMAQTLIRRPHLILQFFKLEYNLLTINDECHIGAATKILEQLLYCWLMGFSATPSAREAPHLITLYRDIVVGPQPHELVLAGRLAPYKHYARHPADLKQLETQYGEFTEESQRKVFETRKVYDGLINDLRTVPHKKCLIFTSCIEHCDKLTDELLKNGFYAVKVHSGLDYTTYEYNLAQFTKRLIPICVSVGILTKGFDFPPIDLIVLHRATTSLPLYLQMIGRGSRVWKGKTHFTVLDYGDNYKRHYLWDYEHDWKTLWCEKKKKKKLGAAPVKNCPRCERIVPVTARTCPECGWVFQKTKEEKEEEKQKTVLLEITKYYNEKLVGKKISELSARELAMYCKLKNKSAFAIRVARSRKDRTFLEEFCAAMGYRKAWVDHQLELINGQKILFNDFVLR